MTEEIEKDPKLYFRSTMTVTEQGPVSSSNVTSRETV